MMVIGMGARFDIAGGEGLEGLVAEGWLMGDDATASG